MEVVIFMAHKKKRKRVFLNQEVEWFTLTRMQNLKYPGMFY